MLVFFCRKFLAKINDLFEIFARLPQNFAKINDFTFAKNCNTKNIIKINFVVIDASNEQKTKI